MTNSHKNRTKKVPPECSGWSFCVLFGMAITTGLIIGGFTTFALLFGDFIESVGGGTSSFTIVTGISSIASSVCALFTGSIAKILSMRGTALLGGILYFLGKFFCIFVTSVEQLIIAHGILMGLGIGFIFPAVFSTFNEYCVEKRVLMQSISESIVGLVSISYPILTQFLMNTYGFRGTLAIIAALNANVVLAMLVMHPVKWHYKIIPLPDAEFQPLTNDIKESVANHLGVSIEGNESRDNEETSESENPSKLNQVLQVVETIGFKSIEREHLTCSKKLKSTGNKPSSEVSVLGYNPIILNDDEHEQPTKNCKWQKVVDFLDLSLLKDIIFLNIVFGLTFATCSDGLFFTLQPMYLFELNISKDDTALIMALIAGFDLGSRSFLSIINMFVTVKPRYIFTFGTVASIVLRFVFLNVFDFTALVIVSALMGFIKTFIIVPMSLVIAEHLPKERLASGFGLFMFFQGFMFFLLSPLIGWIRDVTESYVICFHTLTLFMGTCSLTWIIEIVWVRLSKKKSFASLDMRETESLK